jgi:AcrR family transcriptional regulator
MARPRAPERFQQLYDAALRVFARKGLRRSRMSDVARELGLSPGALYTYVESKEALFDWLVAQGADPGPIEVPHVLPLPTPAPGATEKRVREQIARALRLPVLEAALARRRVADPAGELEAVVRELYGQIERTRAPATVLERSALELPELFAVYFLEARRDLFDRLARYLARRARSGHLRLFGAPALAARWLVETVTYFARHRYGDADPSLLPDDETVREQVVRLVVAALVPERPVPPGGH